MPSIRPRRRAPHALPLPQHGIKIDHDRRAIRLDHDILRLQVVMHVPQAVDMLHPRPERLQEMRPTFRKPVRAAAVAERLF